MPMFFFDIADNHGTSPADRGFEFESVEDAVEEAKTVLAEMALDGLPCNPANTIAVEVQDAGHKAIAQVALRLEVTLLKI